MRRSRGRLIDLKIFIRMICHGLLIFVLLYYGGTICHAEEKMEQKNSVSPGSLYAQSAVLMDGSSGRVLYEKNGKNFMANASTTKILTCILALEKGKLTDVVNVSSYAASMPDVQLHIREGEQYYLGDLLYSLMLESHNDVAVAIAEHIAGSQEEFAKLMNRKAAEIGCTNTMFLTPNGLDATMEGKETFHGTTATDLALIMRYCIKLSPQKEQFLQITRTPSYTFQNLDKTRSFSCRNHNTFLNMMEGALSGKTGFTGKSGYCYVGALEQEGECYIVALLACGWPGNKNYKWLDCRKLMEYGLQNYQICSLEDLESTYINKMVITVNHAKREHMGRKAEVSLERKKSRITEVLLKEDEKIDAQITANNLDAPVKKQQEAGVLTYYINGEKWLEESLVCKENVDKIDYKWCMKQIIYKMFG